MSQTLAALRHKIEGANQLYSVVRTMKAVAASSIGQYEAAVLALGSYEAGLRQGLAACLRETGPLPSSDPKDQALGAIVFGSDQGLVGRFNEAMCAFVVESLAAFTGTKVIWAVGQRISSHLAAVELKPQQTFAVPTSATAIGPLVGQIQLNSEAHRGRGEYSQLFVFHQQPQGRAHYQPVCRRLLPFDHSWQNDLTSLAWPGQSAPEFLTGREQTLRTLIREYLFISIFQGCAESLASENAARLAAMQRAEKNIKELSAQLQHDLNRLRQSSIDEELFDVLAGFKFSG